MAKFYGKVGYGETVETPLNSGVWVDQITERLYYGDVIKNSIRLQNNEKVNSDISVGNSISILADPYANDHFFAIRYVEWAGTLWIVSNVDVESPRLILRLGGVYHGETPGPSPEVEGDSD